MLTFPRSYLLRPSSIVDNFPAATGDAIEGRAGPVICKAFCPKTAPVIGCHLIECVHHIIKGVSPDCGRSALSPMEKTTEIVHGFLALGLLPDDHVHPQPVQNIFLVVIERPPPGLPLVRRGLRSEEHTSELQSR